MEKINRRTYGIHLTSKAIFRNYILPEIKEELYDYTWIDLYAGEGNLILPILDEISSQKRIDFFKNHMYLFDVQPEFVQKCVENTINYGIPSEIAHKNIKLRNNLESFPKFLKKREFPLYHITNPPYLYLGYIRKHAETRKYLNFFEDENEGYQDLYQIAMMNDLRSELNNLVYIIPTNFLFGASVSNKFRMDFLKHYKILKMIVFETKVFEFTGTNICVGFFRKKCNPKTEPMEFNGLKIKKNDKILEKSYKLSPNFKYRAGSEFDEFLETYQHKLPLNVKYYLLKEEVLKNEGSYEIKTIDANKYENNEYKQVTLRVNESLKKKVKSNVLYIRTVDSGSISGRVGLGIINEDFNVQGIYVSGNTYRTHPIQIFLEPEISFEDQILLKYYFNFLLEYFRKKLDSEFLTTYKYSNADYTRKYLGLTQTRKLIETFPIMEIKNYSKKKLELLIQNNDFGGILKFLEKCNSI